MATNHIDEFPRPVLGPRTRREIELRIRELTARTKPTIYDLAELARLRELLKNAGGHDAMRHRGRHSRRRALHPVGIGARWGAAMTGEDALIGFGLMVASVSAVCAAVSFWLWLGFMVGTMTTLVAAAIAGTDFE